MELKVNEYQLPESIAFNYDEIKNELAERVHIYETVVYDDTQIKQAKADRADLNRFKKALNDERIRREKDYLKPFQDFKDKINELIKIVDKPCEVIDKQIKAYEEQEKAKKKDKIIDFWENELREDITTMPPEWLKLEAIFDDRWLNASVSIAAAKNEIKAKIEGIKTDLSTLAELPNFAFEATEVYKSTLDINKAINEGRRQEEIQRKKQEVERLKKEAEARALEEAQAAKEEEQAEAPAVSQPVEEEKEEPAATWVNFSALLTPNNAILLKEFFKLHNIEFKPI